MRMKDVEKDGWGDFHDGVPHAQGEDGDGADNLEGHSRHRILKTACCPLARWRGDVSKDRIYVDAVGGEVIKPREGIV